MKQFFLNLPSENLAKSQAFYEALGFNVNPIFTDEDQKCLVWSEQIYVMLQAFSFTDKHVKKPRANFHEASGPSFTLPLENQTQVLELFQKGIEAGGIASGPILDESFMTLRSIEDPDGHLWGLMYLNRDKFEQRN
jgi:predicted lactoylglutathione lyase